MTSPTSRIAGLSYCDKGALEQDRQTYNRLELFFVVGGSVGPQPIPFTITLDPALSHNGISLELDF